MNTVTRILFVRTFFGVPIIFWAAVYFALLAAAIFIVAEWTKRKMQREFDSDYRKQVRVNKGARATIKRLTDKYNGDVSFFKQWAEALAGYIMIVDNEYIKTSGQDLLEQSAFIVAIAKRHRSTLIELDQYIPLSVKLANEYAGKDVSEAETGGGGDYYS
jgi:hypothetical protein